MSPLVNLKGLDGSTGVSRLVHDYLAAVLEPLERASNVVAGNEQLRRTVVETQFAIVLLDVVEEPIL